MTEKQKRFCDEYLTDFNATRAYKVAYSSCKKDETARANASRMLTNANIQEYIQKRQEEMQNETKITQQQVIDELSAIAFFNIKNIYNEDGTLKSIKDIDDKTARAISSVKTFQEKIKINSDDDEEISRERIIEYKTNDKKGALELLGKHLGMFKDTVHVEQDKPFEVNIVVKKE